MTKEELTRQELLDKHCLIKSKEWQKIRAYLLKDIVASSSSEIEPLKLQGLLLAIKIVEGWESKYESLLKEE